MEALKDFDRAWDECESIKVKVSLNGTKRHKPDFNRSTLTKISAFQSWRDLNFKLQSCDYYSRDLKTFSFSIVWFLMYVQTSANKPLKLPEKVVSTLKSRRK